MIEGHMKKVNVDRGVAFTEIQRYNIFYSSETPCLPLNALPLHS